MLNTSHLDLPVLEKGVLGYLVVGHGLSKGIYLLQNELSDLGDSLSNKQISAYFKYSLTTNAWALPLLSVSFFLPSSLPSFLSFSLPSYLLSFLPHLLLSFILRIPSLSFLL